MLSKVLLWLIQPSVWVLGLLFAGLVWKQKRRILLIATLSVFWLTGNPFLVSELEKAYAVPAIPFDSLQRSYPFAVVLGGFTKEHMPPADRVHTGRAVDRGRHAIALYQRGYCQGILVTGGLAYGAKDSITEAQKMRQLLMGCGVAAEDILFEPKAKNTYQNALYTRQLMDSLGVGKQKLLLVTSAFHMPRAVACFRKQGLAVTPFPADLRHKTNYSLQDFLLPHPESFFHMQVLIKEWVGYLVYSLVGYI